jgi:hypothetical protein
MSLNRTTTSQTGVRRWPRGARLALFTAAVIGTIVVMMVVVAVVVTMTDCEVSVAKPAALCSATGRTLVPMLLLIFIVGLGIPWVQYLARVLAVRAESVPDSEFEQASAPSLPDSLVATEQALPLGQHFIGGTVDSVDWGAHRIAVRTLALRFWGGHALRNGDLATGERAIFVYQTLPLLGLNYVLAFYKGGDDPIRGVGGAIHTLFLALGIVGTILIPALTHGYPTWFVPVCAALFVESCIYLLLLFLAKRALHGFVDRSGAN